MSQPRAPGRQAPFRQRALSRPASAARLRDLGNPVSVSLAAGPSSPRPAPVSPQCSRLRVPVPRSPPRWLSFLTSAIPLITSATATVAQVLLPPAPPPHPHPPQRLCSSLRPPVSGRLGEDRDDRDEGGKATRRWRARAGRPVPASVSGDSSPGGCAGPADPGCLPTGQFQPFMTSGAPMGVRHTPWESGTPRRGPAHPTEPRALVRSRAEGALAG
jgi:hypothetical protein